MPGPIARPSYSGFNPCSLGCCSESVKRIEELFKNLSCFNPCSLGCCSESPGRQRAGIPRGVSILVLLDVALKVMPGPIARPSYSGFNPCSLGCCSERQNTDLRTEETH